MPMDPNQGSSIERCALGVIVLYTVANLGFWKGGSAVQETFWLHLCICKRPVKHAHKMIKRGVLWNPRNPPGSTTDITGVIVPVSIFWYLFLACFSVTGPATQLNTFHSSSKPRFFCTSGTLSSSTLTSSNSCKYDDKHYWEPRRPRLKTVI